MPGRPSFVLFAIAFLISTPFVARGDAQQTASWINAPGERGRQTEPAFLAAEFDLERIPHEAQWLVVADMCDAAAYVNGVRVGDAEGYGPKQTLDIVAALRRGRNTLAIEVSHASGPAAVAAALSLRDGDSSRSIVTGKEWRASRRRNEGWLAALGDGANWAAAAEYGPLESDVWLASPRGIDITPFDDYTQWEQAVEGAEGPDPSRFLVAPGFQVERVRSAAAGEGSWISIAFDPQGRLVISREDKGLLRLNLAENRIETINETLEECRGLLFLGNALYANANNSKALYRLRDADGDSVFEDIERVLATEGDVGHGRNDIALGPDGFIYAIHGDSVDLPAGAGDRTSPFREHRRGARTSEGHLLRIDPQTGAVQIVCAGLRNPYGIDFNADGEPFTYDADAEFDMGSPWYRPTRVHQLLSGGDYGWRGVTGQWPPYYPDRADNAPAGADIGKGSPTAVQFGTASDFPQPYREALYILDWAYGRIVAIHFEPRGAGYASGAETFLKGRPLNVTDLTFGPDGAMYFVTGGRKTQSGLYRVRYGGPREAQSGELSPQQIARREHARQSRALRRELEQYHHGENSQAIEAAWPSLDSPDPALRHAARIAIEHQPLRSWQDRALAETRPLAMTTALLSLARANEPVVIESIVRRLNEAPWDELPAAGRVALLDAYALCQPHFAAIDAALAAKTTARVDALYPDRSAPLNRRLGMLLAAQNAPKTVEKTLPLLAQATAQEERFQHLFTLRTLRDGWTDARWLEYFTSLQAAQQYVGGQGMPEFLERLKNDALASLPVESRPTYERMFAEAAAGQADESQWSAAAATARSLVKHWSLDELSSLVAAAAGQASAERGKQLFAEAKCAACHRVGGWGSAVGPDLTAAASRYTRRDLLDAILEPSKVVAELYRDVKVVTASGRVIVGRVAPGADYRAKTLRIALQPLDPAQVIELSKIDIEFYEPSHLSPMPTGLLDVFTPNEIADIIAFIEGRPASP